MTFRLKQKTGFADSACVAMLCMSTLTLVGFSFPQVEQGTEANAANVASLSPVPPVAPLVLPDLVSSTVPKVLPAKAGPDDLDIRRRPVSYASDDLITSLLVDLDSGLWLPPLRQSGDRSELAPRQARIGNFRGVGFPEIRNYRQAKRSPFEAPGPWAPLVEWRDLQGENSNTQPIASVRCMGLSPQSVASRADQYQEIIDSLAKRYDVNPLLIKAVITEESCFNDKALSVVGAQGLMQLMPDTATWLKVGDPLDPQQNLKGGVRYLASLQKEFETLELVLAAYNAGPGNVRRYEGVPPFAETQAYVQKVKANFRRYEAAHRMLYPPEDDFTETAVNF